MNKKIIVFIIKVVLYALGLIGSYFGISSLTSCSSSHNLEVSGCTRIFVSDTSYVKHNGFIRSKKYSPYER